MNPELPPALSADASDPTQPRKFRLHVVPAAIAVVSFACYMIGGYLTGLREHNLPYWMGYAVGGVIGSIGLAFLLAWVTHKLFHSNLASNLVFCLVVLISNCMSNRGLEKDGNSDTVPRVHRSTTQSSE